ncbi:MAG: hypothetical protein U9R60_00285, partial [Bacteroidota bacterium]|nr:hypothetical protein [Bacteroidota bacterium]
QDSAALWPGLRGRFRGKGTLKGSYENPAVTVALEGNNIDYSNSQYGDYGVENLDVDLAFYSKNMQRSNARIKMINLQVNGKDLSSLSLNWFGDFKNHKVHADVVAATACADIEFAGSCHSDIWEVRVDRASFDLMKYGMWRLRDPVKLLMGHTRMKPFKACWVQEQSTLCTQGLWHKETGWKVEGNLDAPPLIYTASLLKELLVRRTAVQTER